MKKTLETLERAAEFIKALRDCTSDEEVQDLLVNDTAEDIEEEIKACIERLKDK